jgi:hypothetical protein
MAGVQKLEAAGMANTAFAKLQRCSPFVARRSAKIPGLSSI